MKNIVIGFAFGVVITATFFFVTRKNPSNSGTNGEAKEIIIRDTIRVSYPIEIERERIDTMYLAVRDTLTLRDTTYIVLPMERKTYQGEDYKAVVSGYRPMLESIEVYPITKIIERTIKPSKWSVGVQVGVGVSSTGFAVPYVGIGVQYALWQW